MKIDYEPRQEKVEAIKKILLKLTGSRFWSDREAWAEITTNEILKLFPEYEPPKNKVVAIARLIEDRFRSPVESAGLIWNANFNYILAREILKLFPEQTEGEKPK